MIKVKVPGTTANMGPGFDSFGMALDIYNEITVEEIESGFEMLQEGELSEIPLSENLIYTTFLNTLNKHNYKYKGFRINLSKCDVPMSRGLGSSATCIVGGIFAANAIMGNVMSLDEIIKEAVSIEGHPDNVVPAIVGGMAVSIMDRDNVIYSNVTVPDRLRAFVMIPNYKLGTEEARGVLPDSYTREECVFNISRAAMLVNVMNNGEIEKLRLCMQDKIHQKYRGALIRNIDDIFKKAYEFGSLAEFISGSGSTLIAFIDKDNNEFYDRMKNFLDTLEDEWTVHLLKPNFTGAEIIKNR